MHSGKDTATAPCPPVGELRLGKLFCFGRFLEKRLCGMKKALNQKLRAFKIVMKLPSKSFPPGRI